MTEPRIITLRPGEDREIAEGVVLCLVKLRAGAASIEVDCPTWMGVEKAEKVKERRR